MIAYKVCQEEEPQFFLIGVQYYNKSLSSSWSTMLLQFYHL